MPPGRMAKRSLGSCCTRLRMKSAQQAGRLSRQSPFRIFALSCLRSSLSKGAWPHMSSKAKHPCSHWVRSWQRQGPSVSSGQLLSIKCSRVSNLGKWSFSYEDAPTPKRCPQHRRCSALRTRKNSSCRMWHWGRRPSMVQGEILRSLKNEPVVPASVTLAAQQRRQRFEHASPHLGWTVLEITSFQILAC